MSYLDHVTICNRHDPAGFLPFVIDGQSVGHIRPAFAAHLAAYPEIFTVGPAEITWAGRLSDFDSRSRAMDDVLRQLAADGKLPPPRNEMYPVKTDFAGPALLQMDRGAVPYFGVRAFGVHLNGYVRRADGGLDMWVARRAADRTVCPGMLDNMVAGGQPIGLGLMENVVKECAEEAGIPVNIAETARPVGAISYVMEVAEGLKPDTMFCFDLELPAAFVPENTDGEVGEFYRRPVEDVAAIVRDSKDFKFNCNLVIIDFLIRHGYIPPEEPDYMALIKGLRK